MSLFFKTVLLFSIHFPIEYVIYLSFPSARISMPLISLLFSKLE